MPALPDLQLAFASFLEGGKGERVAAAVVGDSIGAEARLRIYRHHVRHSLTTALAATFPTVEALVGEAFFAGMVRGFIEASMPAQPVLSEYGAGLAGFIAGFEAARGVPYLSDVARLDWAMNLAFHTEPGPALDAAALGAVPPEQLPSLRLRLVHGATLIGSKFPLDRIWRASQPDATDEKVDLAAGGSVLLVQGAGFVALGPGEAAFLSRLNGAESLEQAAEAAVAADSGFDLSTCFAQFLGMGVIAAAQQ
jgi:hypothetical protein